jgi:hypothetical protein
VCLAVAPRREKGGTARRENNRRSRVASLKLQALKCGFAGQPERRVDGSDPLTRGNVIPVLT